MPRTFIGVVRAIVQAMWRRRFLIILPVLLAIPLGIAAAIYLPQAFIARSLVMLQEGGSANPLSKAELTPAEITIAQDRLNGLRALLFSEAVLSKVANDYGAANDRERASIIQALQQSLKLEMQGTDFLEFRLAGTRPDGLGRALETVMSRFLEALIANQGGVSAREMLLSRREQSLTAQQNARDGMLHRMQALLPDGPDAARGRLADLSRQVAAKSKELEPLQAEVERLRKLADVQNAAKPDQLPADRAANERAREQTKAALAAAVSRQDAVAADRDRVKRSADALDAAVQEYDQLKQQVAVADRAIASGRSMVTNMSSLTSSMGQSTGPLGILRSPDLIRIVDPPSDPEFPAISSAFYIVSALAAGVLLGAGLAFLAELLDPILRSPEEIAEITGAPIVTRLSPAPAPAGRGPAPA